jgi:hypothetical protein
MGSMAEPAIRVTLTRPQVVRSYVVGENHDDGPLVSRPTGRPEG